MANNDVVWPPSLWAAVTPPGPVLPSLDGDTQASVVVIGGGFAGLSTALHLAEAGTDCVLLEAMEPGWGASGRNNGQVIPTLSRPNPDDLVRRWGEPGERFVGLLRDSASYLFDTVRRLDLKAEAEQSGWMQPFHSPGRIKIAETRVEQWSKWGAPVELLSAEDLRQRTGSSAWFGGFWNRSGGHINPLALARELARAAVAAGVRLFARTPVSHFSHDGNQWIVETARGRVKAKALVLATNAYTGAFSSRLAPDVRDEVVPVLSWQMATEPLGENMRRTILPGRESLSDTHGDLYFMRYDARHRLITGGALVFPVNGAERLRKRIGARLKGLFPQLGDVTFTHVWNGNIGMTADHFPRLHRIGPNGFAWAGCNGRAVALSISVGRELARATQGVPDRDLALPFEQPSPLPFHFAARHLARFMLLLYRFRDSREMT